jgi:acetylornithine deacetylase/succinyl-diaminopimelate desuccinylase-like protein
VAFAVAGAPKEPLDEMPLPDRARRLGRWIDAHPKPTDAAVRHWLYQNEWIVTGARFGWWRGAEALRTLIAVDRRTESVWGVGARSERLARAALAEVEARDPRVALLLEPTLGVTLAPTVVRASEKINVIPARAELRVDCRVPPGLGADHARRRVTEVLGEDGYEIRFDEQVVGNRSPIDSPLMDHIRDFVAGVDPDATTTPVVMPGFTDSRWFREAFPDCVAYGFFPRRRMDLFESFPLIHGVDERIPVEDLALATGFFAELAPKVLG